VTYLLDTNVVSEMRRRGAMHPKTAAWLGSIAPAQLYISSITIFEIERGVEKVALRDAKRGTELSTWLRRQVLPAFDGRVLTLDAEAALHAARLHAGRARLDADRLVAAIALAHAKVIVTRNVKDFAGLGVMVVDPFAG
jgi:toxin FitB